VSDERERAMARVGERLQDRAWGRANMAARGEAPDFRDFLRRAGTVTETEHFRVFRRAIFSAWGLSMQAGASQYCFPRQTLGDLNAYSAWEVALFDDRGFARPPEGFPCAGNWSGDDVAAYVPTEEVQQMFTWLWVQYGDPAPAPLHEG
jgi:hypothetical protein